MTVQVCPTAEKDSMKIESFFICKKRDSRSEPGMTYKGIKRKATRGLTFDTRRVMSLLNDKRRRECGEAGVTQRKKPPHPIHKILNLRP